MKEIEIDFMYYCNCSPLDVKLLPLFLTPLGVKVEEGKGNGQVVKCDCCSSAVTGNHPASESSSN